MAYLRPNLLHTGKLVSYSLFLLLLSLWGVGSAGAHATVNVLLFLFGWLQDLREKRKNISTGEMLIIRGKELTNLERAEQALVNTHHCTCIVEFTTVVGCAEKRDQLALGEEFVTVLNNLMRTTYQVHIVFLEES